MGKKVGHYQRRIRRCFILSNGEPVKTSVLLHACYPKVEKFERWHWNAVTRAAHRFGTSPKRGWWMPNADLMRFIKGSAAN